MPGTLNDSDSPDLATDLSQKIKAIRLRSDPALSVADNQDRCLNLVRRFNVWQW